jgi:hypothetical protein
MDFYLDTVCCILMSVWFGGLYVRDLYVASREFEDFEGGGGL